MEYPIHTLAPDPKQPELDLHPPPCKKDRPRTRASPVLGAYHCTVCGSVHTNPMDRFRCADGQ